MVSERKIRVLCAVGGERVPDARGRLPRKQDASHDSFRSAGTGGGGRGSGIIAGAGGESSAGWDRAVVVRGEEDACLRGREGGSAWGEAWGARGWVEAVWAI